MEPTLPNSVQINEAILCDDMPALSGVQLGPTGKSVSKSYAATLRKLRTAGWCYLHFSFSSWLTSTSSGSTGISDETSTDRLSPSELRYRRAMDYLVGRDKEEPTKSRVDLYREKQTLYTDALERKTKAYHGALARATSDPHNTTPHLQRAAYDRWVAENYEAFNGHVQAAYMNWVTIGKKEEVEHYFSIVDNDSAMSRVNASKVWMVLPIDRLTGSDLDFVGMYARCRSQ